MNGRVRIRLVLNRFGTSIFVRMMFLSGKAKRSELIPRPDMFGLAEQPWTSGNKCKPLVMPCRSFFCEWDKTTICGKANVEDQLDVATGFRSEPS